MKRFYVIGRKDDNGLIKYMDFRNHYVSLDPRMAATFPCIADINKYFPNGVSGKIYKVEINVTEIEDTPRFIGAISG